MNLRISYIQYVKSHNIKMKISILFIIFATEFKEIQSSYSLILETVSEFPFLRKTSLSRLDYLFTGLLTKRMIVT